MSARTAKPGPRLRARATKPLSKEAVSKLRHDITSEAMLHKARAVWYWRLRGYTPPAIAVETGLARKQVKRILHRISRRVGRAGRYDLSEDLAMTLARLNEQRAILHRGIAVALRQAESKAWNLKELPALVGELSKIEQVQHVILRDLELRKHPESAERARAVDQVLLERLKRMPPEAVTREIEAIIEMVHEDRKLLAAGKDSR